MTTKPMSGEKPLKLHICNDAFPGNTLLRWYVGTNLMSHDNAIKVKSDLERAIDRIEKLEAELERERMRLAGCGVAALGYFEGCRDDYKSASLDDVLRLKASCDELSSAKKALEAENRNLKAIIAKELSENND
jgi:hypothetical protein